MKKLFVLGNGFDLAHKVKSKYSDFKKYLITKYNIDEYDKDYDFSLPSYSTNYRHLEIYDEKEFAILFLRLINDCSDDIKTWKNFEKCLGKINWFKIFDNVFPLVDENDDYSFRDTVEFYADYANSLAESCHILKLLFYKWVISLDVTYINSICKLKNLFDSNDLFFTFNYTSTLENVYKVSNVCHIHGCASLFNNNLIVGHGSQDCTSFYNDREEYVEANDSFKKIFNYFKKGCDKCFNENIGFFEKIKDVTDIYFYGFSFSDVDLFYVAKLKEYTHENIKVHVNVYEKKEEYDIMNKAHKYFKNVELWKL